MNIYELRRLVHEFGGSPKYSCSFKKTILGKIADIKNAIAINDQYKFLSILQKEEEDILEIYKNLNSEVLNKNVRYTLLKQMADVRRNISKLKQLPNHIELASITNH